MVNGQLNKLSVKLQRTQSLCIRTSASNQLPEFLHGLLFLPLNLGEKAPFAVGLGVALCATAL